MLVISGVEMISEDEVVCTTRTGPDSPAGRILAGEGGLSGEVLIEIMAQTIGVWAGHWQQSREAGIADPRDREAEIGLLLSVRDCRIEREETAPGAVLRTEMRKVVQDGSLACFEGGVSDGAGTLATGRITVYKPRVSEMEQLFSGASAR